MTRRRVLRGYGEVLNSRCTHLEIKLCSVAAKWVYIFNRRRAKKEIPVQMRAVNLVALRTIATLLMGQDTRC